MNTPDTPEILMAQPRGFCAGVDRAINIVNEALTRFGAPIYVRHEIVHNAYVVNGLREKGAVFVEDLNEVPKGGIVVFSAHGVSQEVRKDAQERGLQVYDATCPLVTKVHLEVVKLCKEGFTVLMIGHAGHPEVEGTMGQVKEGIFLIEKVSDIDALNFSNDEKIAFVTQTTLSVDETKEMVAALTKKFPHIVQPRKQDIC
jgi:4-hydroxy-3-methylbut-2-enyl diphosphate reductase